MTIGIDEVGRGCLAGPVCVVAVGFKDMIQVHGLSDSKKLTASLRVEVSRDIRQQAAIIGIGWASSDFIDQHGMTKALKAAALRAMPVVEDGKYQILLDGNHNYIGDNRITTIINGDGHVPAIAAASVVAKVARDAYMQVQARRFPQYGFERHVGYGTSAHRAALSLHGPCQIHRMSFSPLKDINVG